MLIILAMLEIQLASYADIVMAAVNYTEELYNKSKGSLCRPRLKG